ncbi:hypothetical protein [Caulobacter sp. 17J80-11]|nr:hypothetical protein [Caulobacter sp. 17J80-11]MBC6983493.1 hypothetical protein [Caulobacter sp. 17J80-11]
MSDPNQSEAHKARSRRNVALGGALALFVILVFLVTVVRLAQNVAG